MGYVKVIQHYFTVTTCYSKVVCFQIYRPNQIFSAFSLVGYLALRNVNNIMNTASKCLAGTLINSLLMLIIA